MLWSTHRKREAMPAPALPTLTDIPKPRMTIERAPFVLNPYIHTNVASDTLKEHPARSHAVYMGIPGNEALSMIASGAYNNAILFDINENERKAAHNILKVVEDSSTPEAFIDAIAPKMTHWLTHTPQSHVKRVRKNSEIPHYFSVLGVQSFPDTLEEVKLALHQIANQPNSWLSPKNYDFIRSMQQEGRIQTLALDILDTQAVDAVKSQVRQAGYDIGAVYTSSIRRVMTTNKNTKRNYFGKPVDQTTDKFDRNIETLLKGVGDKWYIESAFMRIGQGQELGGQHVIVAVARDNFKEHTQRNDAEERKYLPWLHDSMFQAGNYILRSYCAYDETTKGPNFKIDFDVEGKTSHGIRSSAGFDKIDGSLIAKRLSRLLDEIIASDWSVDADGIHGISIAIPQPCDFKPGCYHTPMELLHAALENVKESCAVIKRSRV
jgi:hypothetical protein